MNCALNKIVNIYKPSGPSSFDMVRAARKILNVKKAGHIGTLDPMAEGVLPICLNRATRIVQYLSALPKTYTAGMRLGTATDTQDATGKVIASGDPSCITEEQVRGVLNRFIGEQNQTPPMFSAKKKQGIPLYKLARNGITIDRKPVLIQIQSIEFLKKEDNRVEFRVHCSSGTYVRTLCHDIGQELGCGAHMDRLVRDRIGVFDIEKSVSQEALKEAHAKNELTNLLFSPEEVLDFLPEVRVKTGFVPSIANGIALSKASLETFPGKFKPGMALRVASGTNPLIAIVEPMVDQETLPRLHPRDIAFKLKRVFI